MSDDFGAEEYVIQPDAGPNAVPRIFPDPRPYYAQSLDLDLLDPGYDEPAAIGNRPSQPWPTRTAESIAECSSRASSIVFDGYSEYRTNSSAAPSHRGEDRNPPPVLPPLEQFLPCELFGFGCRIRFPLYQVSDWIRHLETDHLRDTFPRNSVCLFCDSPNNDRFRPVSDSQEDRKNEFRRRMCHVAEHFRDGVSRRPRPDWYLLEHLRDIGVIPPDVFSGITQHQEAPPGTLTIDHTPSARRPPSFLQQDQGYYPRKARSNYQPR